MRIPWQASPEDAAGPAALEATKPEQEQAIIRIVMGIGLIAYYLFNTWSWPQRAGHLLLVSDVVMTAWFMVSLVVIAWIRLGKPVSRARRLIAITSDVCNTTYFFHAVPEVSAPLYCLYLWYVVGNGFRYGVNYLYYTLFLASAGFFAVITFEPYWNDKINLGIGLSAGLIAISLYFSTLAKRLQSALNAAEAANLAKRQFVSSISHEMRTPLNAIIGMADLMRSTALSADQAEMMRSLDSGSKMLLALVNDVLDFSKIEAGKMTIEQVSFNLQVLVEDTVRMFKYQAAERGLAFQVQVQDDTPAQLVGDPAHLRQVLSNFLSNAIKFTPSGKILLRIEPLSVKEEDATLLFTVEDTGIGIAAEAKAHIFESFTQADASMTRRYGGTGLGTTIAKQLVELMQGRIGFRSEEGKGSTFWCELRFLRHHGHPAGVSPLAPMTAQAAMPATTVSPALAVQALQTEAEPVQSSAMPRRVLVVDDNATNRAVIARMLEQWGHVPVMATCGEDALDQLESAHFDLAILDMNMPDMSGIEVLRTYDVIRPRGTMLPFVMLTADASSILNKESLAAGFAACLSKPIQPDNLKKLILELTPGAASVEPKAPARAAMTTLSAAIDPVVSASGGTLIDIAVLRQFDVIFQETGFADRMIQDFMSEARSLIERIESGLALHRSNESKQLAHALKGSALSIGAIGLRQLCERFDAIPASQLEFAGRNVTHEMRLCLDATYQALLVHRQGTSAATPAASI
ncbi:ATP-binding protein [Noviherbaspirillum galbum]|uniref:Virulence sensor protein BvgS n=1 Tax=Noviherbaspirillum galbum TaxID=2709383 RepID=A0A6B3SPL6_9BURK|nr:ATP-binding protein [Noviherbaspirillum galbum]NEX62581.1 response regulator [Noviherbaspirillum galbum]